jgi:tellurite resistance-related uncharacterized protein
MTQIPDTAKLYRTTPVFDQDSVPEGLLHEHQTSEHMWAKLHVTEGSLRFHYLDGSDRSLVVQEDENLVIEPEVHHRVEFDRPAKFYLEFYRPPRDE